jgi:nitrogenase molybdenum-iron protein beta chain
VIAEEEDYVYSYLEQAIGVLSWKKFGVIGDTNAAIGITRYLANDYSFSPKYVILSEQLYRPEDKERVLEQLTNLEYAKAPEIYFAADQYEIDQIIRQHEEVTLIVGSSNDREAASYIDAQFLETTFPVTNRLFFNRAIAGYRGSLTLTEDLYDNL